MPLASRKDFLSTLTPPQCPICYEHLTAPITTPCEHTFCLECAKTWLKTAATCPSCRTVLYDIDLDDEEPENDSELQLPLEPGYVQRAFPSTTAANDSGIPAEHDTSGTDPAPPHPRRLLSRLPRLHRPIQHREAALEERRLSRQRWQRSMDRLFRTLQKAHRSLELRRRVYDRQQTEMLEVAEILRHQIQLQDDMHAEIVRLAEEHENSLREREVKVEEQLRELQGGEARRLRVSRSAMDAAGEDSKWSWARMKERLIAKL
ncbi:hypothetical protein CLAFUW4_09885 [Fulvia fulva]|uniref:RING-type domain-containing protein n=1 Tax=Passalora fulva TaxID=5499 RepID=A0A9Q8PIK2_PASFU|nr:uncharacterized protein CLAFUR5_12355 [Fulvia fulva]KAK4615832.1 hypothetical protein CLAFUR4_09890 [Fulvia fulva]KAK4617369.1 hypothetical protein CLAFUR0_09884 [Fulvia fulva]UJO23196.1 hypothetical protein CLAFUR5_12355 [Fulvia fulva]WPV19472.1 hypothetical protein CLAFUW4_09885 [Fulvia fulva]WPV34570.1 hypothetical protein CLAFUW7_09887 [Fulvia fulva]